MTTRLPRRPSPSTFSINRPTISATNLDFYVSSYDLGLGSKPFSYTTLAARLMRRHLGTSCTTHLKQGIELDRGAHDAERFLETHHSVWWFSRYG
jgi:hypothetical protein